MQTHPIGLPVLGDGLLALVAISHTPMTGAEAVNAILLELTGAYNCNPKANFPEEYVPDTVFAMTLLLNNPLVGFCPYIPIVAPDVVLLSILLFLTIALEAIVVRCIPY